MGKNKLNEQELITNPKLRSKHMNRTEVLDRVGDLQFLPNVNLSTTNQVAKFYGVSVGDISYILWGNRYELGLNGHKTMNSKELIKQLLAIDANYHVITKGSGGYYINNEFSFSYSRVGVFTKEAVLNVGMLLETSEVAERVRNLIVSESSGEVTIVEPIKAEPIQKQHNDIVVPVSKAEPTNEIVVIQNNQAVTTSLQVAETFGKEHRNVLRDIESLKKDMLNFEQMFHEGDIPDNYGRPRKAYFMNRDGFTLLAMGFTGKKALGFKLEYINQFNQMENQLKSQSQVALHSYMIEDPIKRAEQWISEQKEKALLVEKVQEQVIAIQEKVEVIEEQSEIIEGLTDNITLDQKRKLLNKVVQHGCYGNGGLISGRWKLLYDKFQQEYGINTPLRTKNFNEKNNKKYKYVEYVEKVLGMFEELFALGMKLFKTDAKKIIEKEKELLMID